MAMYEICYWYFIEGKPPNFEKITREMGKQCKALALCLDITWDIVAANIAYWLYWNRNNIITAVNITELNNFGFDFISKTPSGYHTSNLEEADLIKWPLSDSVISSPMISKGGVFYDEQAVKLYFEKNSELEENGKMLTSTYE